MNQPNNLPAVVRTVTDNIDTDTFFNNLYRPTVHIATDVQASVATFFEGVADSKQSALLLTNAVIYTALAQKVTPMKILEEFKKVPAGQLNLYLATFLNLNRVNTSLLGVINQPRTGFFVKHSILV
jgi:hypothetical protein